MVFEVLSTSTDDCDRGSKFVHYRSVPSLQDYVMLSTKELHVERFRRLPSGEWLLTELEGKSAALALEPHG